MISVVEEKPKHPKSNYAITGLTDGIKKTIAWDLDNHEWWETIISGEYQNHYEKMYKNR